MTDESRIEYAPLKALARWPRNPKLHDLGAIEVSIARFGFTLPLMLDEQTQKLVAGHGRLETLEAMKAAGKAAPGRVKVLPDGDWAVPVLRGISFASEQEAEAYLVADNKLVELGGWDETMLAGIIKDGDPALYNALGWAPRQLDEILALLAPLAPKDPDEIPEAVPARSKLGDLWTLGGHRLLCGDSTKPEDVARLMGDAKAVLMNTDPPYGVAYTDAARVSAANGAGGGDREMKWAGGINNDDLVGEKLVEFLGAAFRAAGSVLADNAAWYLWHADRTMAAFTEAAALVGVEMHRQIIWVKPHLMFGHGDYHYKHEPCLYGWHRPGRPPFYGERNQTTIWEVSNEVHTGARVHPTQKPVELFAIPLRNHTKIGEVCYEPFSGSGSQIIAAEQLGRRCFALELSPRYVDVALARWEVLTGKQAVLTP